MLSKTRLNPHKFTILNFLLHNLNELDCLLFLGQRLQTTLAAELNLGEQLWIAKSKFPALLSVVSVVACPKGRSFI